MTDFKKFHNIAKLRVRPMYIYGYFDKISKSFSGRTRVKRRVMRKDNVRMEVSDLSSRIDPPVAVHFRASI